MYNHTSESYMGMDWNIDVFFLNFDSVPSPKYQTPRKNPGFRRGFTHLWDHFGGV